MPFLTVRKIREGTSAVLLQSFLDGEWWADSVECHCYLRNVPDLLSDRETPYERRFGEPSKGSIIQFSQWLNTTLPNRPKLRCLPQDQNDKGTVQETHW